MSANRPPTWRIPSISSTSPVLRPPLWLCDQLAVAERDAYATIAALAEVPGRTLDHRDPPGWLASAWDRHQRAILAGRATVCPHLLAGGPHPVAAAAWYPGRIVCLPCYQAGALRAAGAEANTCDACRRYSRTTHPGVAQVGVVLYHFATCRRCRSAMTRPAESHAQPRSGRSEGYGHHQNEGEETRDH